MDFNSVAPHFAWLERMAFGASLQRCRLRFLSHLADVRKVLMLGEGDGRFLQYFVQRNQVAEIDCVESSSAMIQLMAKRILTTPGAPERLSAQRLRVHHCDFSDWALSGRSFDLIVTHFFLDCFDAVALENLVAWVASVVPENGLWLLSDFSIPENGWRRWRALVWLRVLYGFFGLCAGVRNRSLVDAGPHLLKHGFIRVHSYACQSGLLKSELWRRFA